MLVEPSGEIAVRLAKEAPARRQVRRKVEGVLAGVAGSHPVGAAELGTHCLRAWVFGEGAIIGPEPGARIGRNFFREGNAVSGPQFRGLVGRARWCFFGGHRRAKSADPPPGRHRRGVASFFREISWRSSEAPRRGGRFDGDRLLRLRGAGHRRTGYRGAHKKAPSPLVGAGGLSGSWASGTSLAGDKV